MCRSHTKEGEKCFERSETFGRKRSKNILKIFCTIVQKEKEEKTFGRNIEAKMRGKKDIWR